MLNKFLMIKAQEICVLRVSPLGRQQHRLTPLNLIEVYLFSDFEKICEGARKKTLEDVHVLIERAPVCKSIFVSGIPEDTPQEAVEEYFDKFGVVEKILSNIGEEKAKRVKDQRAILYFQSEKSKSTTVVRIHVLYSSSTYTTIDVTGKKMII